MATCITITCLCCNSSHPITNDMYARVNARLLFSPNTKADCTSTCPAISQPVLAQAMPACNLQEGKAQQGSSVHCKGRNVSLFTCRSVYLNTQHSASQNFVRQGVQTAYCTLYHNAEPYTIELGQRQWTRAWLVVYDRMNRIILATLPQSLNIHAGCRCHHNRY